MIFFCDFFLTEKKLKVVPVKACKNRATVLKSCGALSFSGLATLLPGKIASEIVDHLGRIPLKSEMISWG